MGATLNLRHVILKMINMTLTIFHYIAIGLSVLALIFLLSGLIALRRKHLVQRVMGLTMSLCFLLLGGIFGVGALSIRGYQALTLEQLAATVMVEPIGPEAFNATFIFTDGSQKTYLLSGDQLLVDAHILKWKSLANIIGFYTSYELARVSGRYIDLQDERDKPRTIFSLSHDKALDIFTLRKQFSHLQFLLDAEYGSASFVPAQSKQQYALMVSASGLLFRKIGH